MCAAESGSGSPLTAEDARCPGAIKFQDVKGHPGEAKLRRSEAEEIVEDLEKEERGELRLLELKVSSLVRRFECG